MRLAGHGLQHEGRPVLLQGCCGLEDGSNDRTRNHYDGVGHGLCSCGETSPCETATAARQRWHRVHKGQVKHP